MKKQALLLQVLVIFVLNSVGQVNPKSVNIDINDTLSIIFIISEFNTETHLIDSCKIGNWSGVCLIDNKPVYGTDFNMPRYIVEKGYVSRKDKIIKLDVSSMYQYPIARSVRLAIVEGGYSISIGFSDGAGTYMVQWVIINDKSIRTIISNDERIWQIQLY